MLFSSENSIKQTKDDFQRLSTVKFVDSSVRFQLKEKKSDYSRQYAHIYGQRLNQMRPLLHAKAAEKWGKY